jgi:hypothetical protein
MCTASTAVWWDDHRPQEDGGQGPRRQISEPYPAALVDLLDDVQSAFVEIGGATREWPDPHLCADGSVRSPSDDEYERVTDPDRFRILWSRAEAWARVLTARGWAEQEVSMGEERRRWLTEPSSIPRRTRWLRPRRTGAQVLALAESENEERFPGLEIGVGDPAAATLLLPHCGCDACDDGAAEILRDLDARVLSIVDGSFELEYSTRGCRTRSSFGASCGAGGFRPHRTVVISTAPWAEDWAPLAMCEPITFDSP